MKAADQSCPTYTKCRPSSVLLPLKGRRPWICTDITIYMDQKYRWYLIDNSSQVLAITPLIFENIGDEIYYFNINKPAMALWSIILPPAKYCCDKLPILQYCFVSNCKANILKQFFHNRKAIWQITIYWTYEIQTFFLWEIRNNSHYRPHQQHLMSFEPFWILSITFFEGIHKMCCNTVLPYI